MFPYSWVLMVLGVVLVVVRTCNMFDKNWLHFHSTGLHLQVLQSWPNATCFIASVVFFTFFSADKQIMQRLVAHTCCGQNSLSCLNASCASVLVHNLFILRFNLSGDANLWGKVLFMHHTVSRLNTHLVGNGHFWMSWIDCLDCRQDWVFTSFITYNRKITHCNMFNSVFKILCGLRPSQEMQHTHCTASHSGIGRNWVWYTTMM